MDSPLSFDGKIISIVWGGEDYTILPIPTEMGEDLLAADVTHVNATLGSLTVHLPVTHAPAIDAVFLFTDDTVLEGAGLSVEDPVAVTLHPADEAIA